NATEAAHPRSIRTAPDHRGPGARCPVVLHPFDPRTPVMPLDTHPGSTDLYVPRHAGTEVDPHLIHTHYFGFNVPEAAIGAWIYIRYQPHFPLCNAGVSVFRGLDNVGPLGIEYDDYEMTLPWPTVEGNVITTRNGLRIE